MIRLMAMCRELNIAKRVGTPFSWANVLLPILFKFNPFLAWPQAHSFAKVTLLCVSQSILFPFVYVVLFPGIIISSRIGVVDFCLSITFPAEMFYSFTSSFQEAL